MPRREHFPPATVGAALFRPRAAYTFAVHFGISVGLWLTLTAIIQVIAHDGLRRGWETVFQVVYPGAVFAGTSALLWWRRPTWVRVSSAGLELAVRGSQPVLLPWSAVRSLRWGRRFGSPILAVTPTSWEAVRTHGDGHQLPTAVMWEGEWSFVLDVWLLRPGRAVLREVVGHHLASATSSHAHPE